MKNTRFLLLILFALGFDFLNGIHDSSNIVATMISSRAFSPRVALGVAALANFAGPFIFGVAVAETIGNVVNSNAISLQVLIAALASAIFWNLFTWYMGFPSSSSHALVGGIIGAVVTFTDITLRKLHEAAMQLMTQRLRTLSRKLLEVQEAERRHIASELHDEVGQGPCPVM